MRVVWLSLSDFRNYDRAEVIFEAGPNVIVGRNGQGKTNLVESLWYLSATSSHRVSADQAMIRRAEMIAQDAAVIRARVRSDSREILIETQLNRSGSNRAQINSSSVRVKDLPLYFSAVLFAPEDLSLVRGEPGLRRRFLDQLLVQRTPRFRGVISDYERVLKQRNALLKSARNARLKDSQLGTLDIWDARLVDLGSQIIDARSELIQRLQNPLHHAYHSIVGSNHNPHLTPHLTIKGAATEEDEEGRLFCPSDGQLETTTEKIFQSALHEVRAKERERGLTLVGPHRDDVIFELNGLPAKGYASHGESWSFALALKLASAQLLRAESRLGDPVLILDDVFAELDNDRRQSLARSLSDYEQIIITAAVYEDVPTVLRKNIIRIDSGALVSDAQ